MREADEFLTYVYINVQNNINVNNHYQITKFIHKILKKLENE